ncbi:ribonuclease HI family protein [Pseudoduganella sp. LjRoot289]|uniref:ribonuclease HI family protein n=1 Tax=Pseudoduganella sp. LjRoot289 TaxID=3342314 RepID=UPI003ED0B23D
MPNADHATEHDLTTAAYQGERTKSRRLAKTAGITETEALLRVLEQAAGPAGLPALLLARAQQRGADQARRAARLRERADKLAVKQASRQPPRGAWSAWFDGSAHPNPGKLGIGGLLCGPDGQRTEISERAGHGSSSEAEYLALIALLQAAVAAQPPVLVVHGDSRVVIDDVTGATTASAGLEEQRAQALSLLAQLGNVTLRWVPRHRNGAADRLSQQAIASWLEPAAQPLLPVLHPPLLP